MSQYAYIGKDGILYGNFPRELNKIAIQEFFDEYIPLVNKNAPANILVDASGIDTLPDMDLKAFIVDQLNRSRKPHPKDRTAIILAIGNYLKIALRAILIMTGQNSVKVFDNRQEALDWIMK